MKKEQNTESKTKNKVKKTRTLRSNESKEGFSTTRDEDARIRTKRVPMGIKQAQLLAPEIPGYYQRWCHESKIERYKKAGYEFVLKDKEKVWKSANKNDESVKLYLMKLPMDFRKEDLIRKRQENQKLTESLNRSNKEAVGNSYVPGKDMKLSREQLKQVADYIKNNK